MIDLYTYGTINGQAVSITLEVLGLNYQSHVVNLTQNQQNSPDFLAINPSGRIPVIIDHAYDEPLVITQTGAILVYLAEQSGQLLGENQQDRAKIMSWLWFQLTDISTNFFNNFYLKSLVTPKQAEAGEILKQRAIQFYQEFEQQLSDNAFMLGSNMSLVDMAAYPVVLALQNQLTSISHPHLNRWLMQMSAIPAVTKGMSAGQS